MNLGKKQRRNEVICDEVDLEKKERYLESILCKLIHYCFKNCFSNFRLNEWEFGKDVVESEDCLKRREMLVAMARICFVHNLSLNQFRCKYKCMARNE